MLKLNMYVLVNSRIERDEIELTLEKLVCRGEKGIITPDECQSRR
jgi:hypothetical protein